MTTYSYGQTERISISAAVAAGSIPLNRAASFRIVGTTNFFVKTDGSVADITASSYVPLDKPEFVSVPANTALSFIAAAGAVGTNYVYVTEVFKAG